MIIIGFYQTLPRWISRNV